MYAAEAIEMDGYLKIQPMKIRCNKADLARLYFQISTEAIMRQFYTRDGCGLPSMPCPFEVIYIYC